MDNNTSLTDQTRSVVTALYAAAVAGEFQKFTGLFDENVVVIEPAFLPWGGVTKVLRYSQNVRE